MQVPNASPYNQDTFMPGVIIEQKVLAGQTLTPEDEQLLQQIVKPHHAVSFRCNNPPDKIAAIRYLNDYLTLIKLRIPGSGYGIFQGYNM